MDFFQIKTKENRNGTIEIYPDFIVGRSEDLMIRGGAFYAIWDPEKNLWSTDEYDVQRLVDRELFEYADALKKDGLSCIVKDLRSFNSSSWNKFRSFVGSISDNSHQLDQNLTFANSEVKKSDYVSKRLPYALADGDTSAWDELIGTLYSDEERAKLEWAIGSIVAGDAKKIQKFIVLYGSAGTGKSTVLDIIQRLFVGYTTTFEAKALGSSSNSFATEAFKDNPLVAIQHDGDLSRIDDNTKLNSIVSHEEMTMNEKFKPSYSARVNAFLFMGTNQPVKISDAKSGIIRRLIDVHPTGKRIPINHYQTLVARIGFELGAIAKQCYNTYLQMGMNYYNSYRPLEMMLQTDVFFNFIEANFDIFKAQDGATLKQAYTLYKEFCDETGINKVLPQYKVREELRNYFDDFKDRARDSNGTLVRSYYSGFNARPFKTMTGSEKTFSLVIDETESIFDREFADAPAQYAKEDGTPKTYWAEVNTTLADIDTTKLHYVNVPNNHIIIDFDLKNEDGEKDLERNLQAASKWPATYAELSKSGAGIHLHYTYSGDSWEQLDSHYSDGIEVKKFPGGASLRRLLTKCNSVPVGEISEGLPIKEKSVISTTTMKSERSIRELIARNLRKEIHPGTKPSVDFIHKILQDAYESGMQYDVTDMRGAIMAFAAGSSNQSLTCLKTVQDMKFASEEAMEPTERETTDDRLVFFDVEVFPNLFVVCWKYEGTETVVRMINPSPQEVEDLFVYKLVGFNNRRYDNHMLYARFMGYSNEQLFKMSQQIIVDNNRNAMFGEAYGLSHADIYDFSSKKQSLKKFEIELGLHHMELDIPWDQPVPEEEWERVADYCANDVEATEATFKARAQDYVARQILAELSGLTVNDTTQKHTARIIFGKDRNPQDKFVYTDLSTIFKDYKFDKGVSTYRGEVVGEGGYVYSEPGIYENVFLLDVESMHPTSIEELNLFGKYTPKFSELKAARMAIKHREFDKAREMLDGRLAPYLEDTEDAEALSYALKIVINIVYGLTSAKFSNPFRDQRNKDNIVAKRGALFMIDLKHYIQEQGFDVIHIKTDSVKVPNATHDLVEHIKIFGEEYGYSFELEAIYDKLCLVNDAVYIARTSAYGDDLWVAVGAQFQHPYVYKTLFTEEELTFEDYCEPRSVTKGAMYIDFGEHHRHHVGRTGLFVPVKQENGGGTLLRVHEDKEYAVTGTKGYFWMEAEMAENLEDLQIDYSYFEELASKARDAIEEQGGFESFVAA